MIKILNIIGARPQIIKAAAISRAIRNRYSDKIEDIILHTGQHYDTNMSKVFIDELQLPEPKYNLNIGSGTHASQTASMIVGLEATILKEMPDLVVAYGDTNSTLAAAVAASKLKAPIAHIEAGLRSFNKNMPEEINRIMCDHVSTLLFSPTETGINNLMNEGFNMDSIKPFTFNNPGIFHSGDVMFDNSLYFAEIATKKSKVLEKLKLNFEDFALVTIHRDHNTDNPEKIEQIFKSINAIANNCHIKFVLPLHPRTRKMLPENLSKELFSAIKQNQLIELIDPVSFFDMIMLEKNAKIVLTDSGGVQKEAYFFKKPCLILRPETEWVELVQNGTAILTDTEKNKIEESFDYFINKIDLKFPSIFGNGNASDFICNKIIENV